MRAVIPALSRNWHTLPAVIDRVESAGLLPFVVFQRDTDAVTWQAVSDLGECVEVQAHERPLGKGAAIKAALAVLPDEPFVVTDADLPQLNVPALRKAAALASNGIHARLTYDTTGRVGSVIGKALDAVAVDWPYRLGGGFLSSNVLAYPAGHRPLLTRAPDGYGWNTVTAIALMEAGVHLVAVPAGPRENHPTTGPHVRRILLDNLTGAMERSPQWSE